MYLVDQLDLCERQSIYNILNNEIASNVLSTINLSDNAPQIISDLLYESIMSESQDALYPDILNGNDTNIKNISSDVLAEVVSNVVTGKKFHVGTKIFVGRNIIMGDQINVKQAAAVGSHARAENVTLNQVVIEGSQQYDAEALKLQLELVRMEMAKCAKSTNDFIAIGEVAKAENAIELKDDKSTYEHLKSAGKWALDAATQVGASLAAEVIKKSMGI